jgi:hypothetical protein
MSSHTHLNAISFPVIIISARIDDHNIKNIVIVATDVHFPTNILVEDDPNHDAQKLTYHELISGPISAIPVNALLLLIFFLCSSCSSSTVHTGFDIIIVRKRGQKPNFW